MSDPHAELAALLAVESPVTAAIKDNDLPGQTRFASIFAITRLTEKYLYVHGLGWHYWDSTRWAPDRKERVQHSLEKMLKSMATHTYGNKAHFAEVGRMSSHSARAGILSIAATLPSLSATPDELDTDPYLLNCANGTFDLRTGELRAHDPADRITRITRAAVDTDANSSQWTTFLGQILPDTEVRDYLQRYIGVALLGIVEQHLLAVVTGKGANGKTTFIKAVMYALGDYAHEAEQDLFMKVKSNPNAASPALLNLMGRRFIVTQESDESAPLAVALMKMLTGGDAITARAVYGKQPVTFEPSHTPVMVTNFPPKVPAKDDALWRRLVTVPFNVTIPEEDRDTTLNAQLQLSADAILGWAIAGWKQYVASGNKLEAPQAVRLATAKYRTDSNDIAQFMSARLAVDVNAHVTTTKVWDAWRQWCSVNGVAHGSQTDLYAEIDKSYLKKRGSGGASNVFTGCTLLDDNTVDDDVFVDPPTQKE